MTLAAVGLHEGATQERLLPEVGLECVRVFHLGRSVGVKACGRTPLSVVTGRAPEPLRRMTLHERSPVGMGSEVFGGHALAAVDAPDFLEVLLLNFGGLGLRGFLLALGLAHVLLELLELLLNLREAV